MKIKEILCEDGALKQNAGAEMNLLFLTIALACAGFVQGLSGFGFGLVSMSLMPLFIGVKQAAVVSTVFTLAATVITFVRHCKDYEWRRGLAFLLSVCLGLPLGIFFLERGGEQLLTRILGALMLVYAAREFVSEKQTREIPRALTIPLGLFSGAMSGAFNLGGVPTAAYAYSHPWTRGQIMAFLQVMIMTSCVLRMIFYHGAGLGADIPLVWMLLTMVPVYAAIWLGHLVLQRSEGRSTRKGIFIFVAVSGFYYLFLRHVSAPLPRVS